MWRTKNEHLRRGEMSTDEIGARRDRLTVAARPEAYIMLSRPLGGEICFACPSQLPDEQKARKASPGVLRLLRPPEQTARATSKALHYAAARGSQLFATLTTANWLVRFPPCARFHVLLTRNPEMTNAPSFSCRDLSASAFIKNVLWK